jgi:hypothetical protein
MRKTAQSALRFAAAITTLAALALPVSAESAQASGFPYPCAQTGAPSGISKDFSWAGPGDGSGAYLPPDTGYCTGSPTTFELVLQGDGNLVIYKSSGRALWASNTDIGDVTTAVMQADGNFVIYNREGRAIWATATNGAPGYLCFQNDGNLVVYAGSFGYCVDTAPRWASGT